MSFATRPGPVSHFGDPRQALVTRIYLIILKAFSILPTPIASSTSEDIIDFSADDLGEAVVVIFAIVLQLVTLAVLGICFFKLRQDKKRARRRKAPAGDRIGASPADVLYVQQNPELDAQQMRHEIATDGRMLELQGDDRCQELPGEETNVVNTAFPGRLHELRGEEHAKELESSREQ